MKINLLQASKPLRYTGGEQGMIHKEPAGKLRFCLTFPDVYEIGMSHLGFKILYSALNKSESIVCERFFAPWPDAYAAFGEEIMVSLEHHHPMNRFDVLGFSFQYELSYVTALQLLKRSGIALKSADRAEDEPIVIAGGCCILNPAPLADFIDVFFIGEMDTALVPAMEALYELRKAGGSRRAQLELLNSYPFTYVPLIEPDKHAKREIYQAFSTSKANTAPLVPLMPAVQDRVVVEISRGCSNGCRFCQAGMIYRPVRERGVANICEHAISLIEQTGYRELSLLSLDSGDYTQIEPLLDTLSTVMTARNVSVALPSLRAETVNPVLLDKISSVRKSGFTIAPEAGTQRLRDAINKNLSEEDIINAASYAKHAGYNGVKLYFMCGLPYETDEDVAGIADLVKKIRAVVKKGFMITVSVSNFVPKPHTVFERCPQNRIEELKRKHIMLKEALKQDRGVKIRCHDAYTSAIEAAIARGDGRLGIVFEEAVKHGMYLDAWGEYFDKFAWLALFEACSLPVESVAGQEYDDTAVLPWSVVDCGIDAKWLQSERERAKTAMTTADCRKGNCSACGVCDFKAIKNMNAPEGFYATPAPKALPAAHQRYEIIYERFGVSTMMSALDIVRVFAHMLLACGVRLKYSEGFNPQPRLVSLAPLPVGVAGAQERLLLESYDTLSAELIELLNALAPDGLRVLSLQKTAWPKNMADFTMNFAFDQDSFDFLAAAYEAGHASYDKLDKKGQPKTVSLQDYLIGFDHEARCVAVSISSLGGFHFPEFFRKAGYGGFPEIVRKGLDNAG